MVLFILVTVMKRFLKTICLLLIIFLTGCSTYSVKEITYKEYNKMINEQKDFIIYIGSDSCPNCVSFYPKLESVVKEYKVSNVYYINLNSLSDEEKSKFNKSINVSGTPTVAFIENGDEASSFNRINGDVSKEKIISRLKANEYIKEK